MGDPNGMAKDANGFGAALKAGEALTTFTSVLTRAAPALGPSAEAARTHLMSAMGSARPWGEFLDRRKFVPPSSAGELRERLVDNLTYYSANYVLCFLVVSTLSILIHPVSFLAVLLVAALYIWLFLTNAENVQLGPLALPKHAKVPAFSILAALVLYISNAVSALGSWALFAVLFSFAHAGARISAKEPDFESPVEPV